MIYIGHPELIRRSDITLPVQRIVCHHGGSPTVRAGPLFVINLCSDAHCSPKQYVYQLSIVIEHNIISPKTECH